MVCPNCHRVLTTKVTHCPNCNYEISHDVQTQSVETEISLSKVTEPTLTPQTQQSKPTPDTLEEWSSSTYISYILITIFVPLFGLLYGAVMSKHPKRKSQAVTLLVTGCVCFTLQIIFNVIFNIFLESF